MEHPEAPPGVIASLAAVTRNALGLLLARVELAALELSEVRNNLLKLLVVTAVALLAGCFFLAFGSVTIVYLAWEALGWKILLIMTLLFGVLMLGLALYARSILLQGKLSLPATMAELKSDRDMLL